MTLSHAVRSWLGRLWSPRNRVPIALYSVSLVLLVTVVVDVRQNDRIEPPHPVIYRSLQFQPISPDPRVATAPAEFRWQPVAGASAYRLSLMEVDRNEIWSVETSATTAAVPEPVRQSMRPGAGFLWMVAAKNRAGEKIAETDLQKLFIELPDRATRGRGEAIR